MDPASQQVAAGFSTWEPGIFSLIVYSLIVLGMFVAILFLTSWVGVKKDAPGKHTPYESGIKPDQWHDYHYPVPFYLVATFFLIFDVESAYIFSWAVAFRSLGWLGYLQMSFFIIVLLVSLFYIWKKGGLEWGSTRK